MNRIVSHQPNDNDENPAAEDGKIVYKVRWHGYGPTDDTFEPIRNLPRNKVVSYYRAKKLPLPANIGDA